MWISKLISVHRVNRLSGVRSGIVFRQLTFYVRQHTCSSSHASRALATGGLSVRLSGVSAPVVAARFDMSDIFVECCFYIHSFYRSNPAIGCHMPNKCVVVVVVVVVVCHDRRIATFWLLRLINLILLLILSYLSTISRKWMRFTPPSCIVNHGRWD